MSHEGSLGLHSNSVVLGELPNQRDIDLVHVNIRVINSQHLVIGFSGLLIRTGNLKTVVGSGKSLRNVSVYDNGLIVGEDG